MTTPACITIVAVSVLAFAAFLVWKAPAALMIFFGNQQHLGAIAATILAFIPAAAAFVPALAKYQNVLIALIVGICGAWGIAIHSSGKVAAAKLMSAPGFFEKGTL